jgi:xylan 1,4-beta-xylosidase
MPDFHCTLSDPCAPLRHTWEHTLGSGHATLALRGDWQAQLRRCHAELGIRHARFHGILDDDMGTLICQNDEYLYSFFNADQIWDFLLSIGMRPIVELSFMPWTLAADAKTVFHYQAHASPPKDYDAWATLIRKLVRHAVERYGIAEVREWYFEVWNEPNLTAFWTGKQDDYFKLYQVTAEAIKSVDASLRVGGPVTAMAAWVPEFLDFCERQKVPADFVDTHYYPTDAFGQIGADTLTQLAHAPRHVMRDQAQKTREQARGRPVLYTEWNASSNPRDPLHDEPYTAAFVTNTVLEVDPFVDCYSFWTFSDIFEENYFPSVPFQGGFGLLNIYGIPKPAYRAYELLHRLGPEQAPVQGEHETVSVWVAPQAGSLTVLATNFAFPRRPIKTEQVRLTLGAAPQPQGVFIERIDDAHANAARLWHELGEPKYLDREQVARLEAASSLTPEVHACAYQDGTITLDFDLPPQGIAAITLQWRTEDAAGGAPA